MDDNKDDGEVEDDDRRGRGRPAAFKVLGLHLTPTICSSHISVLAKKQQLCICLHCPLLAMLIEILFF